jgi:hypothetical protein
VTGDGLLLFPIEGGGALTRPCLVQGLVCVSHDDDESLLLSVCGSGGGLSCGRGIVLRLSGGSSSMERLEVLPDMVGKMVVVGGGEP